MERDIVFSGVHIGEHSIDPANFINELRERCVEPGYNFVTIRTGYNNNRPVIEDKYFIQWAKYLAENKVYFVFLYTIQHAPDGRKTTLSKEIVAKKKEIAGEYFLGDMIGETGASHACKWEGYYNQGFGPGKDPTKITTDYPDMKAAAEGYVKAISDYVAIDRELDVPGVLSVEPTWLHRYNALAGVNIPMLELMYGNPEALISCVRGVARANRSKLWGTYIAHEWYGGVRHEDAIKRKRLELGYKYAYLAGSNAFCLESGDEAIESYGDTYGEDSDICRDYTRMQNYIADYIKNDVRPKGGPKVSVAFVYGKYDGWGGWGGSTVWNQFGREEWQHGEAEHSWRLLDEIGTKRTWNDLANFGEHDLSTHPAYGTYDIIPVEADMETLSKYKYLIFLGWNSMTDETMDKLIAYVENGGKLLMSAAHLNCETKRGGEFILPDREKLRKLFGTEFTGKSYKSNFGVKFTHTSLDEAAVYPGTKNFIVDPLYSAGGVTYAEISPCGCHITGRLADTFLNVERNLPVVIENSLGKGVVTLAASVNYPGHPSFLPLYRALMREFITMSARECEIKVLGNDRLRWSVYEGGKVYLLNTDYDMSINVKVIRDEKEESITLAPLELKCIV